ncbi:L-ribulose-5-phosphate 3-epimerase [Lactiplantibacillus pentosus]|uniref:L-ribulose-5-phosphate 3-epimerase n=1 Tax=Lactiplantibacillus pentosus TaxID=1589 RepID=A0AB37REX0_LACPE|nr:L-ribulose-5-phosphate 3-epimerase [Lactiplantibacillus pentosus]RMW42382.1 L-ribulose-5-phosphate 3-epimerase [Lactiplantibacillus pentosus]RMW48448.1 L-ribulose-5-phosphate 3-epimerase [Lactiplantibacillus pentosus]RMW52585.1 L-ribulose-5-phosphate 3-epimerase [Lactiplantibacillus pentosus]RMW55319.1 L-ribulose-5-phosphate 3-epimerase [Lactiplantibacillus pentosus]
MVSVGIYEKALPNDISWDERLNLVKKLGFNFLELSIDESDERLRRLEWSKTQREKVRSAIWESGIRIHTLMLSGQRRFPLGSSDAKTRAKSLKMLYEAIDLASDLGIRNIQLAGYDVYYEPKTVSSREYFIENLASGVAYAASKEVMLAIETMDDVFINSMQKVRDIKSQIHSPWLQAYPDLGNLNAWPNNDVARELEIGLDNIVSVHLKDTHPVTEESKGQFRDVPFGDGSVDFEGCLRTLRRLHYNGAFTIEMWSGKSTDPVKQVKTAKKYFDYLFERVGFQQEDSNA